MMSQKGNSGGRRQTPSPESGEQLSVNLQCSYLDSVTGDRCRLLCRPVPAAEPAAGARLSGTLASTGCQVQTCRSLGCLAPEVVRLPGPAAPPGPAELMPSIRQPAAHPCLPLLHTVLGLLPGCGCCLTGHGEMVSLGQR